MKIDLRPPNLVDAPVGTVVITTKGFEFEKVEHSSWKDLTSGITWHNTESEKYAQYKAVEKFGCRLPTIEEFRVSEMHGFREVLPNIKDRFFWSSSISSYYAGYARVFSGDDGYSSYGFRGINLSVRCVSR